MSVIGAYILELLLHTDQTRRLFKYVLGTDYGVLGTLQV